MANIAILDDAGFGSGRPGLFGKELYSELVSQINEQFLGNKVLRAVLRHYAGQNQVLVRG